MWSRVLERDSKSVIWHPGNGSLVPMQGMDTLIEYAHKYLFDSIRAERNGYNLLVRASVGCTRGKNFFPASIMSDRRAMRQSKKICSMNEWASLTATQLCFHYHLNKGRAHNIAMCITCSRFSLKSLGRPDMYDVNLHQHHLASIRITGFEDVSGICQLLDNNNNDNNNNNNNIPAYARRSLFSCFWAFAFLC